MSEPCPGFDDPNCQCIAHPMPPSTEGRVTRIELSDEEIETIIEAYDGFTEAANHFCKDAIRIMASLKGIVDRTPYVGCR